MPDRHGGLREVLPPHGNTPGQHAAPRAAMPPTGPLVQIHPPRQLTSLFASGEESVGYLRAFSRGFGSNNLLIPT